MLQTLAAPPSRASRSIGPQQNHGSFLADALGVAPGVAIENQIADDQRVRMADAIKSGKQIVLAHN